jgi:hypothetical protein
MTTKPAATTAAVSPESPPVVSLDNEIVTVRVGAKEQKFVFH